MFDILIGNRKISDIKYITRTLRQNWLIIFKTDNFHVTISGDIEIPEIFKSKYCFPCYKKFK